MTGTEHTSVSAQLPCGDVTVDCLLIWLCCDRCQTVSAVTGDPSEDGGAEGRLADDLGVGARRGRRRPVSGLQDARCGQGVWVMERVATAVARTRAKGGE